MICRKCKENGTLIIRKEYYYCDNCFLLYIDHKFRACIGKNKKIRWNERVLVCLSGGVSSSSLLDLIYSAISINSHKKLRINPHFLLVTGINKQEINEELSKGITEQCLKYNFQLNIVNINKYYSTENVLPDLNDSCELISAFENLNTSATTNHDLLVQMKRSLYIRVANELQCPIIFTGESTTALALKFMSNIAIGRGSQISNDIGFADIRDDNVEILRPMKDITTEELEHYIKIKELNPISEGDTKDQSLQSIIGHFIFDLQENFPSTLTTVCKTAEKISFKPTSNCEERCLLCESIMENNIRKLTAVNATNFSKVVSSTNITDRETLIKNINLNDAESNNIFTKTNGLCYTCSSHISELNNSKLQDHLINIQQMYKNVLIDHL